MNHANRSRSREIPSSNLKLGCIKDIDEHPLLAASRNDMRGYTGNTKQTVTLCSPTRYTPHIEPTDWK